MTELNNPLPPPENVVMPAATGVASRTPVYGLLALVVLATLVLFAVALWRLHDSTLQAERNEAVLKEAVNELRRDLSETQRSNNMVLSSLQEKFAKQQGSQEDLRALVTGGAESFVEAQRYHAAEYFVQQADQRLALNQDLTGAIAALDGAAQELVSSKLPANLDLRKRVMADRQRLAGMAGVDVLRVARQLADLQNAVNGLLPLGPSLDNGRYLISNAAVDTGWLGDLKTTWQQYSGDWFLVRKHDKDVTSPPDVVEGRRIKLALSLALAEARLAALQHETASYQEAIGRAIRLLEQYYANAEGSVPLLAGLQNLQRQAVTVNGDLQLSALGASATNSGVIKSSNVNNNGAQP